MTRYGTSLSLLGMPDAGLATMTEMHLNARHIANAVRVPVIAIGVGLRRPRCLCRKTPARAPIRHPIYPNLLHLLPAPSGEKGGAGEQHGGMAEEKSRC